MALLTPTRSRILPLLLAVAAVARVSGSSVLPRGDDHRCRYIPGDAGWPSPGDWDSLNRTVGGRLIATVPLAHVCHTEGPFAAHDEVACQNLGKAYEDPSTSAPTICQVPNEIFNPYWQNDTCSPFTGPSRPCELGNRPVYSINVTGLADVQAGLAFAADKNVRLLIRNTGIDYLGKSTGQGSLALWTYNLKDTEIFADYESPSYCGPAAKLGAGVIAGEAYGAVQAAGYRIVAAECGLVGITGGYVQGGGQSQLVNAYGLAADQVLEWEVITPRGEYLIATPENNTDLYWALAGGGGGTYAIVLSVTLKLFPEGPVAGGQLIVQTNDTDSLWEAMEIWFNQGPSFVNNTRNNIQFFATNNSLTVLSFTMPDQNSTAVNETLASFLPELHRLNLTYNLTTVDYPSYAESFVSSYGALPYGNLCPNFPILASRLIPRAVVLNHTSNRHLMDVYRNITADGTWWMGCSFVNVVDDDDPSVSVRPPHPPNSVPPAWRAAAAYCNPQTHEPYDWRDSRAGRELRRRLVEEILPALEAVTPGGGVLNEVDPTYRGEWKETFYGVHYERLLGIKHVYDPEYLMYGLFAVGSDEFEIDGDGRLCRV